MFLVLVIFFSAISISLTAAYFSIVGLATMFPGSKEAIIIMGAVLEVGKLVAAVWLHKEWHSAFKFIRNYLLIAVVVLSIITSMGIFGFLSRSHVEHAASIEKEQASISRIELKISRERDLISQKELLIKKIESSKGSASLDKSEIIKSLEERIEDIKEESNLAVSEQDSLIEKYNLRIKSLDDQADNAKSSGIFGNNSNHKKILEEQKEERDSISSLILSAESSKSQIRQNSQQSISDVRNKIDSINSDKASQILSDPRIDDYNSQINLAYERISSLEAESFEYGEGLRALETEMGPITYIVEAIKDVSGVDVGTGKGIRIIIVILIFVFDPLAILLLVAATMSYAAIQAKKAEEEIPPDVREIRNKLLEEIEEYLQEGGIAEHFIDRAKK
jgi:hypothetical protein